MPVPAAHTSRRPCQIAPEPAAASLLFPGCGYQAGQIGEHPADQEIFPAAVPLWHFQEPVTGGQCHEVVLGQNKAV